VRRLAEIYTLQDMRDGSWATWNATPATAGSYVLSVLCARENSAAESFTEVARAQFLSDDSLVLVVFADKLPHRVDALNFLPHALIAAGNRVRGFDGSILPEHFRYLPATRCERCGRLLTVPTSIDSGMGDVCSGHKPRAGSKYATARSMSAGDMRAKLAAIVRERNARKPFRF
jgi:hypothetical protein